MDLTKITMDYFTNKKMRSKIPTGHSQPSLEEVEFYKPRLFRLTNLLLNAENVPDIWNEVRSAYTAYITACINYFKTSDTCTIIQQSHVDIENDISTSEIPAPVASSEEAYNSYPLNIKALHYDMTRFVTKKTYVGSDLPPPRKKEVVLGTNELKYKDCGRDSNILINQDEASEHSVDVILPYSYFVPTDEYYEHSVYAPL